MRADFSMVPPYSFIQWSTLDIPFGRRNWLKLISSLKENASEEKMWTLFLVLTLRPGRSIDEIAPGLLDIEGVKSVAIR
ncbi:hypothetical protein CSM15_003347 [Salmonella enterica subsp. diarizonae]|nr:hypothetical protein [Salmonella enterica]EBS5021841.1 hypothetical protein [Salmonella enterica subsp. enterica serovar Hvittingfoss]EDU7995067.1 hypothetical protein [Salmonella enterica subsp. diarizonae]EHV3427526.1 hypothetical protein [Salmonella enterica]